MITPNLQRLIDAPLADPLKINLPEGKRPARMGEKPVYEGEFAPEKLSSRQMRDRKTNAYSEKLMAVLDYYATTNVPFERIAVHVKMKVEEVADAMGRRGRMS